MIRETTEADARNRGHGRLSHLSAVTKAQQRRASLRDVRFNSGVTALLLAKYVRRVGGG